MSAYIVEDKTINQIVTHLIHRRDWLRHDDAHCGAPTARRLLAGTAKVTP